MSPCCCAKNTEMEEGEKENCGDCRTWEEELYWNRFQSFYFCQILSSLPEFHTHLVIPKKFANNARALLPAKVTLRGPSLASWGAVITKTGEDMFFTDGWEEFVRAYSLQASHILIFKFDGVSAFDVQIFDGENLCEKESAYFVKKCGHEKYAENPRKRASTEDGIEEHSDGVIHRATKQARQEAVNETHYTSKYSHFYSRSRTRRKKYLRKPVSSKASPRKRIPLKTDKNTSIPSGEQGQSNVQTEPSNNEPRNTEMNAPQSNRSFSTETPRQGTPHINESNLTEASPQRRQETVGRYSSENTPRGRGRPKKAVSLASGRNIRTIVPSSKVASSVGRPRKQVSANKAGDDVDLGSPEYSRFYLPEEGRLALEMAREQMNENSFTVVMRPTAVCSRYVVTFPSAWCRKHLPHKNQDLFIRFGDRTFLTRLSYSIVKVAGQIRGGWKRVVEANQLKLYDVCLFNIASRKDDALMLDATVFRAGMQQTHAKPVDGCAIITDKGDDVNAC